MKRDRHSPWEGKKCRDCAEARDFEVFANDGHVIFCRCRHHAHGQWCRFLSDAACEHFSPRSKPIP